MKCVTALLLFFLSSLFSYGQLPVAGQLTRLAARSDTSQRYVIYLPAGFNDTAFYPLLIFLDPSGNGEMPVAAYKKIADRAGIIMAGSLVSHNFNFQSSVNSFAAIYNDIVTGYPVRSDAVWLSGFSGGARAAATIAMGYPEITGVIACGAGFADDAMVQTSRLKNYVSLVGQQDMNYTELLDNARYLDANQVNNIMLTFNGGHAWPPLQLMQLACDWLANQPMRDTSMQGQVMAQAWYDSMARNTHLYQSWLELNQLAKIGTHNMWADSLARLVAAHRGFAADKVRFEDAIETETNYLNRFSILLRNAAIPGEQTDMVQCREMAASLAGLQKNPDQYMQQTAVRCADHIFRSASEYYFQMMFSENYEAAIKAAALLAEFEPAHINPWLLMAKAAARMGQKNKAMGFLKKAFQYKTISGELLVRDPDLLFIFSKDELLTLLQQGR